MEKKLIDGLIAKKPHENAPDFLIANVSIKVEELKKFLDDNQENGWVNIDIKESKGGKYYADLNDWKPDASMKKEEPKEETKEEINLSQIPF